MNVALAIVALILSGLGGYPAQDAPAGKIEGVEIRGNRRIPSDTIKYNLQTKTGDQLNMDTIRRDVRQLYAQGFFEDIRVDSTDTPDGGILITVTVKEKPLIRSVDFTGSNSITKSDILEKLKDKKISLSQESPYDPARVKQAEALIKSMLAEKGHQEATVEATTEDVPPNGVKLAFKISEGPAIRIEKIAFEGNHVFSDGQIKHAMKLIKETNPLTVFTNKDTYYDLKLADDITRIRMLYADNGYVRANILDPVIDIRPRATYRTLPLIKPRLPWGIPLPFWKRKVNRYFITLKIEENEQYRVGTVKVSGAKEFNENLVKAVLGLAPGQVFNESSLRKGFDNLKKLYGSRGYVNFTPVPVQDLNEQAKLVDLTVNIEEDRQFTVNRINFSGNTITRDKVIRRQILVDEGQVFNASLWDLSVLRLNQLGFFDEIKTEDAEIKPNPTEPNLDINLKVKEKTRNSIGFSGGVSGIGGSFLGINYSTNNFLGLGESITLNLQGGTRQSDYQLAFTEPYFLDRPISFGASIYSTSFRYDQARELFGLDPTKLPPGLGLENRLNFEQKHTGFNLSTGLPLRVFHRLGLSYVLDNSQTTGINPATQEYFAAVESQNQNSLTGSGFTTFHARRLLPSYTYNTTNNPYNPTHGVSFTGTFEFTGGFLGGDINYYRPAADLRYYKPMNQGRNTLAMRLTGSFIQSFTNLSVPFYERSFLGGDFDIRGFDFRSLSPIAFIKRILPTVDPVTAKTVNATFDDIVYVGGDTHAVFNLEYRIPLIGQVVSLVPFLDTGNTWALKKNELERKIVTPTLTQTLPAQFLPGTNSGLRMSTGIEFQVVMPVINAPFRFDVAFNPARIDRTYFGPVTGIPIAIHQPNHDFKFTVGRTF